MSIHQVWLNLPVSNITKAISFYKAIGFAFNEAQTNENAACMIVGEKSKFVIMLFEQTQFNKFTQAQTAANTTTAQMLISIDAQSTQAVDDMMATIAVAGGTIYAKPSWNQGWIYGAGFTDIDGHRWNILYMDVNKMPKP